MVSCSGGIFASRNWRTLLKGEERFVIESGALRIGKYVQNCLASHSNSNVQLPPLEPLISQSLDTCVYKVLV